MSGSPCRGISRSSGAPAIELHGNEVRAVDLVDAIDRDDVGVTEGRRGLGFLDKPPLAVRIGDLRRRQNLEGDDAVQLPVAGFVDHTHAAFAERLDDVVLFERAPNHRFRHRVRFTRSARRAGARCPPADSENRGANRHRERHSSTATDWRSWRAFVSVQCGDCRSRSYRGPCD